MPGRPVTARPRRAPVRPTWLRHGRRADHALFRRLTSRPAPAADALLYPLSRAADHSKLWVGCAAVLALSGDRFARRAATRGLLAIGLTSAVTNALIKPLFRRVRPTSEPAPWLVRTARMPGSTSFPSGHAASAAAFAVGAGMELPAVAAPLGLLAAAVGASRVRTRVHYPADVVAGAAVGAAIALGTRRLWAVAPHHPAEVRPVLTRLERRPGSDGSGRLLRGGRDGGGGPRRAARRADPRGRPCARPRRRARPGADRPGHRHRRRRRLDKRGRGTSAAGRRAARRVPGRHAQPLRT
jgi:undecaprenyl-diphosphatase